MIIIPIYFFIYSLDDLYSSSKEKTLETLRQSILVYAKKVEDRMNPLQYLESELSKIHTDLIPDFPNKIISGIPDKNVISQVYNKKVFSKLLSLTKDRFAPLLIIFGTNNFEEIYSYCSPELNSDFESLKDKNTLLRIKTRYDLEILRNKYINFFKPQTFPRLKEIYNRPDDTIIINNRNKDPCYRYLSRYKRLKNNYATIYTDYFNKQCLYPILLYTFSQYGVHGYYSLLVPQSHVDPNDIIKSVLSDKNLDVKISLESNKFQYQLNDTHEGIQYHLDFPPFFINHIKTFELLGGTVDSDLLGKHFKLSLDYPNDLLYLKKLVSVSKKAGIIICILYTIISIWLLKNTKQYNILITRKITCVLSIVILFPIIAIMI